VRFLIGAQLSPSLARQFSDYGHQAAHVLEIGLANAPDSVIWSHAAATDAVLVTKDEDFVMLRALDNKGPALIWVRIGNTGKRVLAELFAEKFPEIIGSLERGDTIIEISAR
jgi:predicted nuclease of predicted toxin-antitoxin system